MFFYTQQYKLSLSCHMDNNVLGDGVTTQLQIFAHAMIPIANMGHFIALAECFEECKALIYWRILSDDMIRAGIN